MSSLDELKPIYFPSECDLDKDLFLPIAKLSESIDCMVGYFKSNSLSELASSILCFLNSDAEKTIRFIVSPNLDKEDIEAIKKAISQDKNLLPLLFPDYDLNETALKSETLKALCYMIVSGKLELRIAFKYNGLFHSKIFLFETSSGEVAIHGSANATYSGLYDNFEQLAVSKSWENTNSQITCEELRKRFNRIWNNNYDGLTSLPLNDKTIECIEKINQKESFNIIDTKKYLIELLEHKENIKEYKLQIPAWLKYTEGEFEHQGRAVKAWQRNGYKGILSIATGGGKTLTSLIAATLLNQEKKKLFVVIAVPTKPLLEQWGDDVDDFGVRAINSSSKSKKDIKLLIKNAARNLRNNITSTEVLIITHEALKSDVLEELDKEKNDFAKLLIADEVHNLGSVGFIEHAPEFFENKIGLSATPVRQYDEEGTDFIVEYFNGIVFEFNLQQAIGKCLVPYDYFVHEVLLTAEEEDEFSEISYKIKKLAYARELPDTDEAKQKLNSLYIQRRKIVESAANKVKVLDKILPNDKNLINRTLFFCTDKYPEQIKEVNYLLHKRSVNFHQVTQEETARTKTLNKIVDAFNNGDLQALTSKRVLDEGFNVPQTEMAYLVASNTVERQWIQRLGRVLRLSPQTNKEKAIIHDFMVIPFVEKDKIDNDLISLIRGEYNRLSYFSELSGNGLEKDGSMFKANKLLNLMRKP